MKRQAMGLLTMIGTVLGLALTLGAEGLAAPTLATLQAVTVSDPSSGKELLLRIEGACSFKSAPAGPETFFIDLTGARAGRVPAATRWSKGLLASYQLLPYADAKGQPVLRVQIETRQPAAFTVQHDPAGLRIRLGSEVAESSPASSPEVASVTRTPAAPAAAPARPASHGALEVSGVSIKAGEAGETLVDIATSRAASFQVSRLDNPRRLVVDFAGAQAKAPRKSYEAQSSVLKDIRVGQFRSQDPAVARVVADLSGDPVFDVHAYPGGVRIELKLRHAPGSPMVSSLSRQSVNPRTAVTEDAPVPSKSELPTPTRQEVSPQLAIQTLPVSPNQELASLVSEPAPPQEEAVKDKSNVDYQNALPVSTEAKEASAAPQSAPANDTPETLRAAEAAKTLELAAGTSAGAVRAVAQGTAPAAGEEKPKYTGEPISLNLKDVDLKDFFRLIHEISGLNIIIDPNVSGSVTLVLDAVPWDQALDIVLKNNGLGKVLEGNVLRIARVDTLTAEQEAGKKLTDAREDSMPLVTVFRPVNYAKAATIAGLLKGWPGGGALTRRGNILVDDRTNTVIISDIQSQIPVIESIVAKLDKRAKQVSIETRIVLASSTFQRTLTSALSGGFSAASTRTLGGGATQGSSQTASVTPPIPTSLPNTGASRVPLVISPTGAAGFGAFAITNSSANYFINAAIAAAESTTEAKTISRPTIVTQNNVKGMVMQGVQIPIQTTINNTISIQYQNATLQMNVTPQVTDDGNIFLDIIVQNATPGAVLTSAGPSINTQSATTQVLVPDGGTVIFGGVTVTQRAKTATYVPLLGSIPVLGHLFKSSTLGPNTDQELLFFVTPKVLAG